MRIGLGLSLGTAGALRFVLMLDFKNGIYSSRGVSGGFGDVVTFNRASTGTYWAQDGTLQTTAVNEARFEYDRATGTALGLRVEGAATNQVLWSADVSNAVWGGIADFTPAPATSVIAGQTAQKVTNNGTLGSRRVIQGAGTFDGGWKTVSVIWEADTATSFLLTLWDSTASAHVYAVRFDSAAMTAAPDAGTGLHKLTDLGIGPNGGRLVRAEVSGIGTSGNLSAYALYPTDATVNTNAAFVHHTQSEAGIGATSPIVTGASAVTRAADIAIFAGDPLTLGLDSGYTLFGEGQGPRTFNADGIATLIGVGTAGGDRSTVAVRDYGLDGTYDAFMQGQGGEQTLPFSAPVSLDAPLKLAVAVDAGGWIAAKDGVVILSDATAGTVPAVPRIDIGAFVGGSRQWGGTIERIVIYPTRLTDAQLQEITA